MNRLMTSRVLSGLVLLTGFFCLAGMPSRAAAAEITLQRPGDREFVRDLAGMLDDAAKTKIRETAEKLLKEKATPIIVVTIDSMAEWGGEGMTIESFSTILFNQWQIGHAKLGDQDWNTGILLLVSKNDRKARIELGGGWGRSEDATARRIMNDLIVPRFKEGKFSEGIVAGVEGLDAMARKLELPTVPRPMSHYLMGAGFIALAAFTGISLYRRGSSGWAWLLWGVVFSILGTILYQMLANSGRSGGGGGFGGGSFGGGSSGGGGATGSW